MKIKELREKTIKELEDMILKTNKDYEGIVTSVLQNKEKNVKKAGLLRKEVARIKTIIKEKLSEEN